MTQKELRYRKFLLDEENALNANEIQTLKNQNSELEILVSSLKQLLNSSRIREKKLIHSLQMAGGDISLNHSAREDKSALFSQYTNRAGWLIGLLILQSFSSYILSSNEELLKNHPSIIFFLTMLVGAGGNAGNQATVRIIRELTLGTLNRSNQIHFLFKELIMAILLSITIALFGFVRVSLFGDSTLEESIAISLALLFIVFASIIIGSLLPLAFQNLGIDPANSSTSIQVIMDISGVLITCYTAFIFLDSGIIHVIIGTRRA